MTIEQIALVCHEANRAYCMTIGDYSQKPWEQADQWQRDSAIAGVMYAREHPDAPPFAQHEAWLRDKRLDGWVYGQVKDAALKTHPCMVDYDELPIEQRLKDALFVAVVRTFLEAPGSKSAQAPIQAERSNIKA